MNYIYKKTFFLLTFLLFWNFYSGAATISLSLDDAINRALDQSINLQKSAIDLNMAQYRANSIWSEFFPSFSLGARMDILPSTPLFTDPGFGFNPDAMSYSLSFGVTMRLHAGIPSSMMLTELAYRRGLLDYENARKRVTLDITKIFYNLLAGQVNLINLENSLNLAERQLERNRIARANGLIGELPWLQSRLSVETARYTLSTEQGAYDIAFKDFLTALGFERDIDVVLIGSINPEYLEFDTEAIILEYLPRRPDIISQRQTIERLELSQRQRNLSSKAPSLSLSAGWSASPRRNTGLTGNISDNLSASISLSIPIDPWIPGTSSNQDFRAMEAELEKARLDLIERENLAKAYVRSLSERLRNSWNSIEIARLRVEIAQRTYELSEAGFNAGTMEFLSFENTYHDLNDARFRLLQSELAYFNYLLDLAYELNVDLETLSNINISRSNN